MLDNFCIIEIILGFLLPIGNFLQQFIKNCQTNLV